MSDYCEISDLPVDQCACRIHKAPEPLRGASTIVARFTARFDSGCDQCGRRIHEGDLIGRTDDGDYICERCSR